MKGADRATACLRTAAIVLPMIACGTAAAQAQETGQPASSAGVVGSAVPGTFSRALQSPVRYTLAPHRPQSTCRTLRSLPAPTDVTILSATPIPATDGGPAHCRVRGVIAPEVQFDVSLPEAWNRRFYMFGNGGYAGEDLDRRSRQDTRNVALAAGFAVADTNTGHDADREPLGTFAASRPKLVDYAFRAVHRTVEEAKRIIAGYYGRAPDFSYWDACSTGGRQGLTSAQRFPDDFDGILAGAPVSNFVDTMVNYIWNGRALEGVGLTAAKMQTVADAVLARCDAKDGLEDQLITDPRHCDFDPARDVARCTPGQDGEGCLTERQAGAISAIYDGIRLPGGERYFQGFPRGSEGEWPGWIIAPADETSRQMRFGTTFLHNMAFGRQIPDFDPDSLDFAADLPRMSDIRSLVNATDPDLSAFERRGGKLIMYHGWADAALTPLMSVHYYDRALAANGADTPDFFRLFMIPGMFHCRGGDGTDQFDGMTALIDWVENGIAPDSIPAAQVEGARVSRTRPLCPYPQVATHSGSGSIDDAANFTCRSPG